MRIINRIFWILIVLITYCCILKAQKKAEVRIASGIPTLFIDGRLYPPFAYMSYLGEKKYYEEIASTGIHLYCFPAYFGDRGINSTSGIGPFRKPLWIGENQYDFSSIIEDFRKIIESDSQAKIIIRFYLDPPLWWEKKNPDASCQLNDGSTFRQCFSSEKWYNETGKVLEYCIKWLLGSPYSRHLVGIHVAAGSTEEWFYHPLQRDDKNPLRLDKFRKWLENKYKDDNLKLQRSWADPHISFNTAVPADINNEKAMNRWRDIRREQKIIDTYQFNSETLVDDIEYFCKIVKRTSDRALLTGCFNGYHYFVTDPRMGHGSLARLLKCKDLDFISSPNDYNRVIGEDWPPMAAIQSVQMHGKLWLAENDTRTSVTTLLKNKAPEIAPAGQYVSGVWLGPEDMETSVSYLWKNTGRMLTQGYGGWWFDMWGGWFSHPKLLNVLAKTNRFYTSFPQDTGEKMKSQICVIVDEQLSFWDASFGQLSGQILSNSFSLSKTGSPYDLYLRSDLAMATAKQYKIIWLMGFLTLSEEEIQKVKEWQQRGITIMWTDSSGTHLFKRNQDSYMKGRILWTDSQLRDIWENAGVHVYMNTGDVFYIGRNWLCIHTIVGGKKTIRFPFSTEVINPVENRKISGFTKEIEINMPSKSTILLRLTPR